jgi:hypothetical protein
LSGKGIYKSEGGQPKKTLDKDSHKEYFEFKMQNANLFGPSEKGPEKWGI